jgi:hypothetical protein
MNKETKCTCERPDDNTCNYCEQESSIQILEEAAAKIYPISGPNSMWNSLQQDGFIEGAKWQQERSYNEEEVYEILLKHQSAYRSAVRNTSPLDWSFDIKQWFEQFKKK